MVFLIIPDAYTHSLMHTGTHGQRVVSSVPSSGYPVTVTCARTLADGGRGRWIPAPLTYQVAMPTSTATGYTAHTIKDGHGPPFGAKRVLSVPNRSRARFTIEAPKSAFSTKFGLCNLIPLRAPVLSAPAGEKILRFPSARMQILVQFQRP